ncbi:phosphoglucomutase/phosphomannomutase family protein [Sporofaciens musculi]|uniref:phosphoglucomutase/phosphomannomutase family protein n=1 Tax=Sporofaciens musculi TaxID=2681861 RepID=UPI00257097C9|nr:phosphoglucomutase/phosphomannomutase family protein [Sporofaciens musculi]
MIKFGTGGWRAVIGDEFTRENIQKLAKAMAFKMKAEGVDKEGLVIGYDRRFLSKETVYWTCEVMAAEGIKVWFVNRSSPTPLIMYYVMKHDYPYGMMVTASHNPSLYNGIKVFTRGGRDANEEQTKDIEKYLKKVEDFVAEGGSIERADYDQAVADGMVIEFNPLNEYLDNIIERIDMEAIKHSGLFVAVDPMFGVSLTSLKTILAIARCDMDFIHTEHDTLFGRKLPAPTEHTLKELQGYVAEHGCDLGIATDGDADRLGVIDDEGKYLHPNDILVLLYYYLIRYKGWKGPVVRNIATTHMLDKVANAFGESCHEVPVGFKHISSKMQETGAIIGGESSGGLTVKGHINGKDGIYAAMLLVEMIAVSGKKLSEIMEDIYAEFGKLEMEERDYKFTQERKEAIYKMLMGDRKLPDMPYEVEKVSYLDGCKVYFKNGGWIIARFSGTEPLLRIFCEMENIKQAKALCDIYEEFLGLV